MRALILHIRAFSLDQHCVHVFPEKIILNPLLPGFQVRDGDVAVSVQLFAQPLPDLLSQQCFQLSQTVSSLMRLHKNTQRNTEEDMFLYFPWNEVKLSSKVILSVLIFSPDFYTTLIKPETNSARLLYQSP